jgi:hypothetical protein
MLTLRKANTRFIAERRDDGKLTLSRKFDRYSAKDQKAVAASFGWTVDRLLAALDALAADAAANECSYPIDPPPTARPAVFTRRRIGATEGVEYLDPVAAFDTADTESVVEWCDREVVCACDIDYHAATPPRREWLEDHVHASIAPRPFAWKFSRSGGLHLLYRAASGFTAAELAAIATLSWLRIDGRATIDLVTVLRH